MNEKPCHRGRADVQWKIVVPDQHFAGQAGPQQSVIRFSHLPAFVQTIRLHQPDGPHSTVQLAPPGLHLAPASDFFFAAANDASAASASAKQVNAAINIALIESSTGKICALTTALS
ncbi:MAG: hypothetical protein HY659_09795 [Rhizobiales bacterium]|nr:hypothetical protein [Hyphomicrobiales bacterium]